VDCNDYGDALNNIWLSGLARSNDEMPEVKDNGGRRGRDRGSILGCDGFGLQDLGVELFDVCKGADSRLTPLHEIYFQKRALVLPVESLQSGLLSILASGLRIESLVAR